MSDKKYVLIVAGGSGNRMNSSIPKQFMPIHGKPLLMYTFEAFSRYDPACIFLLVLPLTEIDNWNRLCEKHNFTIPHKVVAGGKTRFHSVKKGLKHIHGKGIVFIHDGVRPLVFLQTIHNCYLAAKENGNALPVISPSESVREIVEQHSRAVDRERYFLVQTPQTFQLSIIKAAYKKRYQKCFTDDASVLEYEGVKINLVQGNPENIKITYPSDIKIAAALIDS